MRIAVVGAGIMGTSTALACADRGHQVTVFEQFPLNHSLGSSHGRSRIVRKAYPDPFYTAIMLEGYPMWRDLQARVPKPMLHETGLLYFGPGGNKDIAALAGALREHGVKHRSVGSKELGPLLPGFVGQTDDIGVLSDDGGWVQAETAVRSSLELARKQGAMVVNARADPQELTKSFDRVLVLAGAWAKDLFKLETTILQQTFGYLQLDRTFDGPVWIEAGPDGIYGFPSEPGAATIKFGVHSDGIEVDPNAPRPPADNRHVEVLHDFAKRRLDIVDPNFSEITTCLYTRTPNEDFRWGRFASNGYFASPCSGHGFKFGPWIGARMADFAEDKADPADWPRFNVAAVQLQ